MDDKVNSGCQTQEDWRRESARLSSELRQVSEKLVQVLRGWPLGGDHRPGAPLERIGMSRQS